MSITSPSEVSDSVMSGEVPAPLRARIVRVVVLLFLLLWTWASLMSIWSLDSMGYEKVLGSWNVWLPSAFIGGALVIYSLLGLRNPVIKIHDDYFFWAVLGSYRRMPFASIHSASRWMSDLVRGHGYQAHLLSLHGADKRVLLTINIVGYMSRDLLFLHEAFEQRGIPITLTGVAEAPLIQEAIQPSDQTKS